MSNYRNVTLKRSALTVALGFCLASSVAFGQSAVGSLSGSTTAGATVTIENTETGSSREITADSQGRFAVTQLAPGTYTVTSGGKSSTVAVRVGTGSAVNFDKVSTIDTVIVSGSQVNSIDVSSVESTTVFTAAQIERLPVARDVTSVALLAPGTVKGDTGFGNLASFGGASVAENGYYINGFDVTNLRTLLSFADLPFEAIGQQQVKTGGYGAEYGRSLGGVIGLVTKRGTNEWKSGASIIYTPDWGRQPGTDVVSKDPADLASGATYWAYRSANTGNFLSYNVWASGPIIQDRLFFFGLIEGKDDETDTFGRQNSNNVKDNTPSGMFKLDWSIADNHSFELTAIRNKTKATTTAYTNNAGANYVGAHQNFADSYTTTDGGEVIIGKYTGYITDNFTVSLQGGRLENTIGATNPPALPGYDCVRAFDSQANSSATLYTGCWNQNQTVVPDVAFGPNKDTRTAYRADFEWRVGDHNLRFGYDTETYSSKHPGTTYTGGSYWRHYYVYQAGGRTVNGVALPFGTYYARQWIRNTASGSYDVHNTAAYLEDSWQVTDNVLLYAGLRNETFQNLNGSGETFIEAKDLWAPRLGFSWDVNGDASLKVFGNAGRYYIPVASNTNIRGSGAELYTQEFFRTTGFDPVTGLPTGLGAQIGTTAVFSDGSVADPTTLSATNLKPMYQDEYILGMQKMLDNGWAVGVKGVYRSVGAGMDDYCGHNAFVEWADDNGYDNFDWHSAASCVTLNPGEDTSIRLDLEDDGNFVEVLIPASYFGMPKYKREYRAVEFNIEKSTADWSLQASYTWSKSYGNTEGYVNSGLEQADPGATQDFDFAVMTDGTEGYLSNDRRHVIKAFGSYMLNDQWRLGGSFILSSGRPVSCYGYADLTNVPEPDKTTAGGWSNGSFYCTLPDGTRELRQRGSEGRTPWLWTFDASVAYLPSWGKDHKTTFKLDVFNIFNMQRVTEYNETSDYGGNAGRTYEPNFLNDTNYQAPRSLRFSVSMEF